MAKKQKKETVVLENIELKPQVIGYTYKKKNNIGRVIFIFIIFILVIFYINDISVFFNNLLGRTTSDTITDNQVGNKNPSNPKEDEEDPSKKTEYHTISNDLNITLDSLSLNNFKYEGSTLSFDINNTNSASVDFSGRKIFIETYSENQTLLERMKLDINTLSAGSRTNYTLDIESPFQYITLTEKTVDDYPLFNLNNDNGTGTLTCNKGVNRLEYTFNSNKLVTVVHTMTSDDATSASFASDLLDAQSRVNSYNSVSGVTATLNNSDSYFSAVISIDLSLANTIRDKYYFTYEEQPKVVAFEMRTYGFACN